MVPVVVLFSVLATCAARAANDVAAQPRNLGRDPQYKRVCYYTNWSQYRKQPARYFPFNIDPFMCTHLIFAFAKINYKGHLGPYEWNDIQYPHLYKQFNGLKKKNPHLKTLLAVGGWTHGSRPFTEMVKTKIGRKAFIDQAVQYLRAHNFDGLDLDWEYPANRGSPPDDKKMFSLFIKEVRAAFEDEATRTGNERLLITAAVAGGEQIIQSAYEVPVINKYLDFINLMSYDLHGSWSKVLGMNAPLYRSRSPDSKIKTPSVDDVVQLWLSLGATADKLVMGISTYGRSFTMCSPDLYSVGDKNCGSGNPSPFTRERGFVSYYEVSEYLKQGWTRVWLKDEMVPYAYSPKTKQWVGYDDVQSVSIKAQYIKQQRLAGAMIWAVDLDDFANLAGKGEVYPLCKAIRSVLEDAQYPTFVPPPKLAQTPPRSKSKPTTKQSKNIYRKENEEKKKDRISKLDNLESVNRSPYKRKHSPSTVATKQSNQRTPKPTSQTTPMTTIGRHRPSTTQSVQTVKRPVLKKSYSPYKKPSSAYKKPKAVNKSATTTQSTTTKQSTTQRRRPKAEKSPSTQAPRRASSTDTTRKVKITKQPLRVWHRKASTRISSSITPTKSTTDSRRRHIYRVQTRRTTRPVTSGSTSSTPNYLWSNPTQSNDSRRKTTATLPPVLSTSPKVIQWQPEVITITERTSTIPSVLIKSSLDLRKPDVKNMHLSRRVDTWKTKGRGPVGVDHFGPKPIKSPYTPPAYLRKQTSAPRRASTPSTLDKSLRLKISKWPPAKPDFRAERSTLKPQVSSTTQAVLHVKRVTRPLKTSVVRKPGVDTYDIEAGSDVTSDNFYTSSTATPTTKQKPKYRFKPWPKTTKSTTTIPTTTETTTKTTTTTTTTPTTTTTTTTSTTTTTTTTTTASPTMKRSRPPYNFKPWSTSAQTTATTSTTESTTEPTTLPTTVLKSTSTTTTTSPTTRRRPKTTFRPWGKITRPTVPTKLPTRTKEAIRISTTPSTSTTPATKEATTQPTTQRRRSKYSFRPWSRTTTRSTPSTTETTSPTLPATVTSDMRATTFKKKSNSFRKTATHGREKLPKFKPWTRTSGSTTTTAIPKSTRPFFLFAEKKSTSTTKARPTPKTNPRVTPRIRNPTKRPLSRIHATLPGLITIVKDKSFPKKIPSTTSTSPTQIPKNKSTTKFSTTSDDTFTTAASLSTVKSSSTLSTTVKAKRVNVRGSTKGPDTGYRKQKATMRVIHTTVKKTINTPAPASSAPQKIFGWMTEPANPTISTASNRSKTTTTENKESDKETKTTNTHNIMEAGLGRDHTHPSVKVSPLRNGLRPGLVQNKQGIRITRPHQRNRPPVFVTYPPPVTDNPRVLTVPRPSDCDHSNDGYNYDHQTPVFNNDYVAPRRKPKYRGSNTQQRYQGKRFREHVPMKLRQPKDLYNIQRQYGGHPILPRPSPRNNTPRGSMVPHRQYRPNVGYDIPSQRGIQRKDIVIEYELPGGAIKSNEHRIDRLEERRKKEIMELKKAEDVFTIPEFRCPSVFGIFPNREDCRSFYQCVWFVPFHHMCGKGTVWNNVMKICDWPSSVSSCST